MRVRLYPAADGVHKMEAHLESGAIVPFGVLGYSDYTTHKDPHRMARYILRHGGITSTEYQRLKTSAPQRVHAALHDVQTSRREDWNDPRTPGFWSRWVLWRDPSVRDAIRNVPGVTVVLLTGDRRTKSPPATPWPRAGKVGSKDVPLARRKRASPRRER